MNPACKLLVAMSLLLPRLLSAHEGHEDELPQQPVAAQSSGAMAKPHLLADGQLYVPKAVQRVLGLRTAVFGAQAPSRQEIVAGEVVADPNAAGGVTAAQAGRLEAAAQGWPLPGHAVAAGATLAYLRPLMSLREQAQRRAALAQLDNDLQISEINVARLKLQAEAGGAENSGNVYYEQARLEWQGLQEKVRLESAALNSRVAIRAKGAGLLLQVRARPGEVVAAGQPLFEVADAAHLRIALRSFDPALATRLQIAQLRGDDGAAVALALHGQEPLAGQQGWRLLFDAQAPPDTAWVPGQIVSVALQLSAADRAQALADACVAGADRATIWVHVAPERFERRGLPGCELAARDADAKLSIAAGERLVTQGAALLSEYR